MAIITDANIPTTGIGGPSPAPDYTPPSIIWKDADEIYVPKGRYYKAGYRFGGQYQDLSNLSAYWDVADRFAVDVDATYSAGSTSGMVGGDMPSSWYSVFMVGADEILLLPFIRVDTISYSAPITSITTAAHSDGTTASNGWVSAVDCFNGYRLVLINNYPTKSGNIYTIADTGTSPVDNLTITGDITADVAATEWLQMVPPDGTACLYLGCIIIESDGSIARFLPRILWRSSYWASRNITGNQATSAGNTSLALAIPPVARSFYGSLVMGPETNSSRGLVARFYGGTSGTDVQGPARKSADTAMTNHAYNSRIEQPLSAVCQIRNHFAYIDGSGTEQPQVSFSRFDIMGYEE